MIDNLFKDKEIVILDIEVIDFELSDDVMVQFAARKYLNNEMVDKINLIIRHDPIELPDDFVLRTRITDTIVKKQGISLAEAKKIRTQSIVGIVLFFTLIGTIVSCILALVDGVKILSKE